MFAKAAAGAGALIVGSHLAYHAYLFFVGPKDTDKLKSFKEGSINSYIQGFPPAMRFTHMSPLTPSHFALRP